MWRSQLCSSEVFSPERQTLARSSIFFFFCLFSLLRWQKDALIVCHRQECWFTRFPSVRRSFSKIRSSIFSSRPGLQIGERRYGSCFWYLRQKRRRRSELRARHISICAEALESSRPSAVSCLSSRPPLLRSALPAAREPPHGRDLPIGSAVANSHNYSAQTKGSNLTPQSDRPSFDIRHIT